MRILVVTRQVPLPPNQGGDVTYSRELLEALSEFAEVHVLAHSDGHAPDSDFVQDGVHYHLCDPRRGNGTLSVLSALPVIAFRNATTRYRIRLADLLTEYWDGILLDQIGSGHVLGTLLCYKRKNEGARLVYVSHEHETSKRIEKYRAYGGGPIQKAILWLDGKKVSVLEGKILSTVDLTTTICSEDMDLYAKEFPTGRFCMVTPGYSGMKVESRVISHETPRRLIVLGGRESRQKQVILRSWLNESHDALATDDIQQVVVGKMDDGFRTELQKEFPKVEFLNYVSDLAAVLDTCRIAVLPDFLGGGFKLRSLSLLFHRTPMAVLKGSIDGLGLQPGTECLEAQSLSELVSVIRENIDRIETLNAIQDAAFVRCLDLYSWSSRARLLISALQTLNGEPGAGTGNG